LGDVLLKTSSRNDEEENVLCVLSPEMGHIK